MRPAFKLLGKLVKYLILTLLAFLVIFLIIYARFYPPLKATYELSLSGKQELMAATTSLKERSWLAAEQQASAARNNFQQALLELDLVSDNFFIKQVPLTKRLINDLVYLAKSGEILGQSLAKLASLGEELATLDFSEGKNPLELPPEERASILQLIYESGPELTGLKANLQIALYNLNQVRRFGFLWPLYDELLAYRTQLAEVVTLSENLEPLSKLLLALGGYPQASDYLIILQNTDELRPSGGFIGSFALLSVAAGDILSLETKDSYHVDMPASELWQKEPPAAIKKYLQVDTWYFRDANWSPDWPSSAKLIEEIYRGEHEVLGLTVPNFAGIISLNPDFIADLISLVGEIEIEGTVYQAEDFQAVLQYSVEMGYKEQDISSWERKNVINLLATELRSRLSNLPLSDWPELIRIINRHLAEKNIQLYFKNPALQGISHNLKADGEVKKTDSDYLLVVDANLAAFKSDAVMLKDIDYTVRQHGLDSAAELKLKYRHEGGFDWRTTRYRSYTRIYLPLGSTFVSLSGLNQNTADWSVTDDWELEKTVFSFFLNVEPGTEREFVFHYLLPQTISEQIINNQYQLLVQKQSGRRTRSLTVKLETERGFSELAKSELKQDQVFSFKD